MEINYIKGDLFQPLIINTDPAKIVLPHVVNNQNKFGAGFVIPLGRTFPIVKEQYLKIEHKLGDTQFVEVNEKITVANMTAQTLGGLRPLYYNHLAKCMDDVANFAIKNEARIIAPMFGSDLSGGNWTFIENLIQDCWLRLGINVTIHFL